MSNSSEAFSAVERIRSGDWDRFILHLHIAIVQRVRTDEFKEGFPYVVAGKIKPETSGQDTRT